MAHKLIISDSNDLTKFYVKRPDGGNYIAFATLDVKSDNTKPNKYWYCGDMERCNFPTEYGGKAGSSITIGRAGINAGMTILRRIMTKCIFG